MASSFLLPLPVIENGDAYSTALSRRNRILHMNNDENQVVHGREEINDEEIERLKKDHGFEYEGHESGTCPVCLEDLSGYVIRTPSCSHDYHEACIVSWLNKNKNSCPLCRTKIL